MEKSSAALALTTLPGRLRIHLSMVIGLKIAVLVVLWWFFFRSELRPPADSEAVADKMLAAQEEKKQRTKASIEH